MDVPWLHPRWLAFPHPETADSTGILAFGGDLSPERLLLAYQWGIFPWYNEGEPIIWWHPDPRFVLYPQDLKVSKSMRSYFNLQKFRISFDEDFPGVIARCQSTGRRGQDGTWITPEMQRAYMNLHNLGYAHSVEAWDGDTLVGGLYGLALGKVFFGESMFSHRSNASKMAFITLVRWLVQRGFTLIDCQQETPHLASLGAVPIPRSQFLAHLADNRKIPLEVGRWRI